MTTLEFKLKDIQYSPLLPLQITPLKSKPIDLIKNKKSPLFKVFSNGHKKMELLDIEKIPPKERLDSKYNIIKVMNDGVVFIANCGLIQKTTDKKAKIIKFNENGTSSIEKKLDHDIVTYGMDVNSNFCSLMDSKCRLHFYDECLMNIGSMKLSSNNRVISR